MILPLTISYIIGEKAHNYFIVSMLIGIGIGASTLFSKNKIAHINFREAVLLVTLTWVSISILGAIPFYLTPFFSNFVDAFFESISGFTATGSTVLSNIEALPQSVLFWRSETHWLGGMGIIVLSIIVLPKVRGNKFLFESEAPLPPEGGKLFAKTKDIAKVYWKIYIALTLIEILFLLPVLSPLDAITHSFSSIAGGGFSTKNNSVAYFNSIYVEFILSIFMLAGATSFILHFKSLTQRRFVYFNNTSFKIFISIITISTFLIAGNIFFKNEVHYTILHSLRIAAFQVISLITTTGFATADFKYWPQFSQLILIILMFVGGMSASTSGAIKVSRLEVIFKNMRNVISQLFRPTAIKNVEINGASIKAAKIEKVYLFVFLYISVFIVSGTLIVANGNSIATSFSAVAATLGNVGPGIDQVGPFDNFLHFSIFSKIVLSFCMLLGRLEIWTALLLFSKYFWTI